MFVKLIKTSKVSDSEYCFVTDNKTIGFGYTSPMVDVEIQKYYAYPELVANLLSSIPEDVTIKFISKASANFEFTSEVGIRAEELKKIGSLNYVLSFFIEKKLKKLELFKTEKNLEEEINSFKASYDVNHFKQLGIQPSPISNYEQFFKTPSIVKLASCGLQLDAKFYGILKLTKLGTYPIDIFNLIEAREDLPIPHTITTSLRKLTDAETQLFLKKKSKQESSGNDLTSYKKFEDVQKSIAQADLSGKKFIEIEQNIIFYADDEKTVLQSLFESKNRLKGVGEFEPEIFGCIPSFLSSRVAGKIHHKIIERDDKVQAYLPIYSRGNGVLSATGKRAFTFHRSNNTVTSLDPYATFNTNYSGYIIGQSGRGKSVFNNTLLKCLLNDEKCRVILVDVMGSYNNFAKQIGGTIHKINSTDPSGISPLEFIKKNSDKSVIEIVLDYLEKLLLEDDETNLKKSEQVQLEKEFLSYVHSKPKSPSIDGFLEFSDDIPRKINLERWRSRGLFGNIFQSTNVETTSRLQYFDFTEISGAANGGVSKAVMSAIMAHFNFLLINKKVDEKLVFMCDETPFFVKSCYSSFTLLSKNVRKLSGSLILTAQMLSDLVINGDASLVSQSEFRIFFSADGTDDFFKTFSGVSDETLETLKQIRPSRGAYSLFIFKDGQGERLCKLILSKEEYYTSSTHADDKTLIQECSKLFNLKSNEEAIKLISHIKEAGII